MAKAMMTIRPTGDVPTLSEIQRQFGLTDDEVDHDFGVVGIDPSDRLFTFLVEETAARKVSSTDRWDIEGPYANPRIEPFGPPELP
jgi:hypothetical protein